MFLLAAELKMTVAELGDRMSAKELQEWIEYQGIVGCLDSRQRGDLACGIVASTVANANRSSRSSRSFVPQDFMAFCDRPKQSPAAAIRGLKKKLRGD